MHIPKPNDTQFELPPAGNHMALCYRVIDLGTQDTTYMGQAKRQHKVLVSWELPDEKMSDGRPFTISQRYTWSMSEKAALRKDLESWRGAAFRESDFGAGGFDIQNIIGKACLLNIVHKIESEKTYANIKSISKLMKGMNPPTETANDKTYLWLHPDRWSAEIFGKLTDGLKQTIMKAPEYRELMNGHAHENGPVNEAADDFAQEIPF